jgi:nucleoside 2-deoxyribosyltransferase
LDGHLPASAAAAAIVPVVTRRHGRERQGPTPSRRARCYVASPHGFTAAGRHWHDAVLIPVLDRVVEVVDPWGLTDGAEIEAAAARGEREAFLLEVGRRNAAAIDGCTLLVACLDGQEVDAGTAAEVGYAAARGVLCHGLRTDVRTSGEEGAVVNLQVAAFIAMSGGAIARDVDDLVALLGGPSHAPIASRDRPA